MVQNNGNACVIFTEIKSVPGAKQTTAASGFFFFFFGFYHELKLKQHIDCLQILGNTSKYLIEKRKQ